MFLNWRIKLQKAMKILFMIILLIHGLIHILGFMKAFLLAELNELTNPISKPMGLLWLLATLVFLTAGILLFFKNPLWWFPAIVSVLISQMLIFIFWKDSLYGTFPNILILVVSLIGFAHFNFERKIKEEVSYILEKVPVGSSIAISLDDISTLPIPVQTWMKVSGIIGKEPIKSVYMKQNYLIKLKPEQKDWYSASAEQYSTVRPPSFVWKAELEMMPFISAFGRDKFIDGEGEMVFKLFSVFAVANDGHNSQINEAALQRFLGEIAWYPSAALGNNITWESIDGHSAKATLTIDGLSGSGIFTFDQDGHPMSFSAMRYQGSGLEAKRIEWVVTLTTRKDFEGIIIPTEGELTWKMSTGDWNWAKFEIMEYSYNPKQ
jgi:hypothetical protein